MSGPPDPLWRATLASILAFVGDVAYQYCLSWIFLESSESDLSHGGTVMVICEKLSE